ncbi:MAG: hypothetical protein JXB46_05045 [Candidatus Eisenbacteria bacterium]|nr:hypothetical protein [Candidatus Eisenbacteria bacterium]
MKVVTFALIALFVLGGTALAVSPTNELPDKEIQITDPGKPDDREGGEDIASAWPIFALPFMDTGNTCDNVNNYDEVCPYSGSTSPDVVYSYQATENMCVSISLCNSYYDTKVYVYEDGWTPGYPIACNDDSYNCVNPPVSYTSWIEYAEFSAGHTYYIVVDGYGSACGDYVLEMEQVECCDVICVDGTPEGEPTCYYNYNDTYNAGCNSSPESYLLQPTGASMTWCGESGVYGTDLGTYRDTDWYLMYACGGMPITLTIEAEFGAICGFIDMSPGCDNITSLYSYVLAPACTPTSLTEYLPYGQFCIFVSTDDWLAEYVCGSEYILTVDGYTEHCDPTPVEDTTWGSIKSLYR